MKKTIKAQKRYAEGGKVFGGMTGKAESALKGRRAQLDAALAEAEGGKRAGGTGGSGSKPKVNLATHKNKPKLR